jgi:hypothetical protein
MSLKTCSCTEFVPQVCGGVGKLEAGVGVLLSLQGGRLRGWACARVRTKEHEVVGVQAGWGGVGADGHVAKTRGLHTKGLLM